MNLKLGEALIKARKLTPEQLEETLKEQAIFGGKFGTNLIEMGYIEEDELAEFLSQKTGIPFATPEQLMDVPPDVIALLPEEVVKKYRVMPISLSNRRLTLAMVDPCDFAAIDEIAFITGYIITPLITPELRLVCALEKHYDIPRETRYFRITQLGRRREPPAADSPAPKIIPRPSPFTVEQPPEDLPVFEEPSSFSDPDAPPVFARLEEGEEEEKGWQMEKVARELANASNRQAIADLVVRYASQDADRAALFLLKSGKALGWVAYAEANPVEGFQALEIPLAAAPLFEKVAERKSGLLGSMPPSPATERMRRALGGEAPEEVLILPLVMRGTAVALLYLEAPRGILAKKGAELKKVMDKAALAFEILILKSKILMT